MQKNWGRLEDVGFPRLLHKIYVKRDAFALLELQRQRVKKKIFFKDGIPAGAKSNVLSECTGRLLLKQGIISQNLYEKTLEIMRNEKKRHGEVLIEQKAITSHQLNDILCLQVRERLMSIFAWPEGIYFYKKIEGIPQDVFIHPISPADAIISSFKKGYLSYETIEPEMKWHIDDIVVISRRHLYNLDELCLSPKERRLINCINGSISLKMLLSRSRLSEKEALSFIYCMIVLNILLFREKKREAKENVRAINQPRKEALYRHDRVLLDRLSSEFSRLESMNYFEIFNVSRYVDNKALKRAYFRLAKEYHPDRYHNKPHEIRAIASGIFTYVNNAYNVLSDENERQNYLESLKLQMRFDIKEDASYSINAELQFQKGRMALLRKDYRTAAEVFERAIKINPNEAEYKAYLGWAIFNMHPDDRQHIENARNLIRESVATNPNQDRAYYFLGVINRADGKLKEAESAFNKAIEKNPHQRDAVNELKMIRSKIRKEWGIGLLKRLFNFRWGTVKVEG